MVMARKNPNYNYERRYDISRGHLCLFDSLKKLKEYKDFWPPRLKVFLILSEKRTYFQFHTEYGKKVESQRVQELYESHNLIAAVCDSK